ncbi:hypothetical protein Hypma_001473 [Hypsizygus marmoreus]|uniref:F-box domain-containing protein n=1 Tax=Hypsizygus marmoreus TaxID=39966 RepID=A0A369K8W8_HYPMA|nr:hypothetical protein Hypma_001473 [Hypsizygus marmoreus]
MNPSCGSAILDDDVLPRILCFCDIAHVLKISETSRHMHELVFFSKAVWLAILSDLHAKHFVNLLPKQRLSDLTAIELLELAKRIIGGPQSWSPSHPLGPTISHQTTLKFTRPWNTNMLIGCKLLPGDRFLLYQNDITVQCWNLAKETLIWEYPLSDIDDRCKSVVPFDAELAEDGRSVVVVLGLRVFGPFAQDRPNTVEVIRLDLITGKADLLLRHRALDTGFDNPFSQCKISGDFILVKMNLENWSLLLKMSTAACMTFNVPGDPLNFDNGLVNGHMVTVKFLRGHESVVEFYDLESVFEIGSMTPFMSQTIDIDLPDTQLAFHLSINASPFYEDQSTAWFRIPHSEVILRAPSSLDFSHYTVIGLNKQLLHPDSSPLPYSGHVVIGVHSVHSSEHLVLLLPQPGASARHLALPAIRKHVNMTEFGGVVSTYISAVLILFKRLSAYSFPFTLEPIRDILGHHRTMEFGGFPKGWNFF